jgi:hypothetical protein
VGFLATPEEKRWLIDRAVETFLSVGNELPLRIYSTISWFLLGQSYCHEYERFESQCRMVDESLLAGQGNGLPSPGPASGAKNCRSLPSV